VILTRQSVATEVCFNNDKKHQIEWRKYVSDRGVEDKRQISGKKNATNEFVAAFELCIMIKS